MEHKCPYCNSNNWHCEHIENTHLLTADEIIVKRECRCENCNKMFIIRAVYECQIEEVIIPYREG